MGAKLAKEMCKSESESGNNNCINHILWASGADALTVLNGKYRDWNGTFFFLAYTTISYEFIIWFPFSHLWLTLFFTFFFYLKILLDAEMIKRNSNYFLSFFRVFYFFNSKDWRPKCQNRESKNNLKLSLSMMVVGLAKPCLEQKEGIRQLDCPFSFASLMVHKSNPLWMGSINRYSC